MSERISVKDLAGSTSKAEPPAELPARDLDLSLPAELLLLAISPERSGLLAKKKKVNLALAVAARCESGASEIEVGVADNLQREGRVVYRDARDELERHRLVKTRGLRRMPSLTDSQAAGRLFRRIDLAIESDAFDDSRDVQLFALLAWSGVLARRIAGRTQRVRVRARLSKLVPPEHEEKPTLSPTMMAIGLIVAVEGAGLATQGVLDGLDVAGSTLIGAFDDSSDSSWDSGSDAGVGLDGGGDGGDGGGN